MAIKIITPGCKPIYHAYCTKCGCHFTYEQEDIINNCPTVTWTKGTTALTCYVACPCCGEPIYAYQYQPVWSNHGTGTVTGLQGLATDTALATVGHTQGNSTAATIKMPVNTDDTDVNINLT